MIQPIGKWIALSIIAEEIKSETGIIYTGDEVGKMQYRKGKVINVGKDVLEVKAEDTIYYHKGNSFTMLSYEGEPITWIQERDVLCVG